jgi:hypothetical protein
MDGLKDDIKSIVMVQRPKDLDTAFVLAQLQEEVGDGARRKEYRKPDLGFHNKSYSKPASPMPLPQPPKDNKQLTQVKMDDKWALEVARGQTSEDKLASLYDYCKAKDLCYKCGLRYSRGHKCADSMPLHVVEELWQVMQLPESDDRSVAEEPVELNVMCLSQLGSHDGDQLSLSQAAAEGSPTPRTIKFLGNIQGCDVLVLLDSGNSASFVCAALASQLIGVSPALSPLKVQVANGSQMLCQQQLVDAIWSLNGYQFQSTLKVLPLQTYDMIVGMDWLEAHSPMLVHWSAKWLEIPLNGEKITLHVVQADSL